jgi:hypothetical protein
MAFVPKRIRQLFADECRNQGITLIGAVIASKTGACGTEAKDILNTAGPESTEGAGT